MYEIMYLPIAKKDLFDIVNYISEYLKAPRAAKNLLDELEDAILKLENFPFRHKVYKQIKDLQNEYRLLPVKNYAVFYVVNEFRVGIHRILYLKMDLNKFIPQK